MKFLLVLIFAPSLAWAKVVTKDIDYTDGVTPMKGMIAYDDAKSGLRPGILVVHEWWGNNAYARGRAKQLAELGYVAMAVDMFGDGKSADHPEKAGAFVAEVFKKSETSEKRFSAARAELLKSGLVDASRLAAIGYCFGGSVVIDMAKRGLDLKLVASFHGGVVTPTKAEKGKVKANILVFHGNADPMIPKTQIDSFKKEMAKSDIAYEFYGYDGASHGFTNPDATKNGVRLGLPIAYNKKADETSWSILTQKLALSLK